MEKILPRICLYLLVLEDSVNNGLSVTTSFLKLQEWCNNYDIALIIDCYFYQLYYTVAEYPPFEEQ